MTPVTPLADAARRLPVELAVGAVFGALLAAALLAAFVTVGTKCPGARHGVAHLATVGCAR